MRFFLPLALTAVAWGQTGLRCEYRVNPEGIDVQQPRLIWLVQPKDAGRKNVMQSGYRILASSTVAALEAGRGDLWDSGKVASSQSVHVEWAGKPLTSRTAVYWKVEVWDEKGASLGWSPAAHWSMGLLRAEDWKARWIGREETSAWRNPASPFRHLLDAKWIWPSGKGVQTMRGGFDVSGGVRKSAVCVMAADSSFELRLNGRSVGRGTTVQAPAMWDIEPYLRAGRNEFEITATPNARNTSGLIGAFRIDYAAGPPLLVTSGATWGGTSSSSIRGNSSARARRGRWGPKKSALTCPP